MSGTISDKLGSFLSLASLNLCGNAFNGSIPQALQSLRGLNELDLSHNQLSGGIPDYLGKLPFLQHLNLSFNDLEGPVPEIGIFRNSSAFALVGNKELCGGISELELKGCRVKKSNRRGRHFVLKVVIPITVISICLTLLAGFIIFHYRRKKLKPRQSDLFNPETMKISYGELLQATDNFSNSNLLGAGSYGSVYKGTLGENETIIAVKVLNLQQRGASKSFMSECKAMKNIRHRNLLKTPSVCSSMDYQGNDFRAVIYEFMPKGNLDKWLHPSQSTAATEDTQSQGRLSLTQRVNLAIDIASALEYLHCHCETQIIHSDLKPSNVLLDENTVAHVGDFGLSKVISATSSGGKSSSVMIKGSIGYIAPEYGRGEAVSTRGDIYSYGILLLEMFTGKRPTDEMFKEDLSLHSFSRMAIPDRVMDIADPYMAVAQTQNSKTQECLMQVLQIGISCSVENPRDRMEITDIVRKLHSIKKCYVEASTQP